MKGQPPPVPMIVAAAAVAFAPHALRLPSWIAFWCLAGWGWSLLAWRRQLPPPGRWARNLLALFGFGACMASFGFAFDRSVGAAILAVMIGLKPMEVRSYRDRMVTAFLLYFLTLTSLLYADTFFMLLYMLVSVTLTTALLVHIQDPEAAVGSPFKRSGQLVLLAIPVMILFFVLFPRLPGGFWQLSTPNVARTGFSETLSPGSISSLVLNREIAFRAALENAAVPAAERYWRGLVFSEFDGRSWRPGPEPPAADWEGPGGVAQQIELEPHHQRWLFALDRPLSVSAAGRLRADRTFQSAAKVRKRIRYSAVSATGSGSVSLQAWEKRSVRALPPEGNPAARELAARWKEESGSPARIIERVLTYFGSPEFIYSRNPPLLGSDPIDDFLLNTKKGFCEHYASAFAFLMRAAGVPARIVVGYLGGEENPFGGYLIVRQSDAHAWVEVWLEDRGWTRIDPTTVVAPERAEGGTDAALPPEERVRQQAFEQVPVLGDAIRHLALGWDAANTFWNRRVLGYSAATQRRILSRFGIEKNSWRRTAAAFAGGFGLAAALLMLVALRPKNAPPPPADNVQRAYLKLCTRLERLGVPRLPHQGPLDYQSAVVRTRPDLAEKLSPIFNGYIRLRYGGSASRTQRDRFVASVRRLSLDKAKKRQSVDGTGRGGDLTRRPGSY